MLAYTMQSPSYPPSRWSMTIFVILVGSFVIVPLMARVIAWFVVGGWNGMLLLWSYYRQKKR